MTYRSLPLLMLLLLTPAAVEAQLVVNPTRVEFTKSADHDVLLPDNSPLVVRYELRSYATGATEPMSTYNLGKPTPNATGLVSVNITELILGFPINPAIQYTARVAAIGPTGEGLSTPSNSFTRAAPPQAPGAVSLVRP